MAFVIDGAGIAKQMRVELARTVSAMLDNHDLVPNLAVVLVGDDLASHVYIKNKKKSAAEVGIESQDFFLPSSITQDELLTTLRQLNNDANINGVLLQLPLPMHLDSFAALMTIAPHKDVDCFHPENVGRLSYNKSIVTPCTPTGAVHLARSTGVELEGGNAVVIGRSNVVGRPVAQMLLNANCSVTIAHSKTKNLPAVCAQADILISAVGHVGLVTADFIKEGAVVIDVGINRNAEGKVVGDVDFHSVAPKAAYITPVPGGVGPMTIAYLLHNTVKLCAMQNRVNL